MTEDKLLDEAVALLRGLAFAPAETSRTRMRRARTWLAGYDLSLCAICHRHMPTGDRLPYVIADGSHVHAACVMAKQAESKT